MKEPAAIYHFSDKQEERHFRTPWRMLKFFSEQNQSLDPMIYIPIKLNNLRCINSIFKDCNEKLNADGYIVGFFETLEQRRRRLCGGRGKLACKLAIYRDFIIRRVLPKLPVFRELDERFHLVRNRAISLCEMQGRLAFCGFEMTDSNFDDRYFYFKAKKIEEPQVKAPTYGIFIRLPRVSVNGKIIYLHKIRTMHSYAQYLHNHLLENHGFRNNGKLKNDFRIPDWGRKLRKCWIDEVPQIINLIKGDIRLFGVRALSEPMFRNYPEDLRIERIKIKPGLIPPYYVDMPNSIEDVYDSERRYLEKYKAHPLKTDVEYFFKALGNIVFRGARSS